MWREQFVLKCFNENTPDGLWDGAMTYCSCPVLQDDPEPGVGFAELPSELADQKNFKGFEKDLGEWLYQESRLTLLECEALDAISEPQEEEQTFRDRLAEEIDGDACGQSGWS